MINLGRDYCSDFNRASNGEWLETNGIGGFASSSVAGVNTRRYHTLLTAAINPPLGRINLLSKYEECLVIDGERFELSSNQYPEVIHPEGFRFMTSFALDPFPVWKYEISAVEIERSLFMPHGSNTTICVWRMTNSHSKDISLEIRPLIACRDYHSLRHKRDDINTDLNIAERQVSIKLLEDMPELFFSHNAGEMLPEPNWYRDFEYEMEKARGFDYREDLLQPFVLKFKNSNEPVFVAASTDAAPIADVELPARNEIKRRAELIRISGAEEKFDKQLVLAADQFIVSRGDGKTIIAGYPWFSDWGRDTMISLNGLTIATGRTDIAKHILREFANHLSEGMLPNRFPDEGELPEYNTVDATLWFFEAIRAYTAATGDFEFVRRELYERLIETIEWHENGTRYGIGVDSDGLLAAGTEGVQLTWMDAKVGDWVVTPRIGKPVEIQALWYNALRIMEDLASGFGDIENHKRFKTAAAKTKRSFNRKFWYKDLGYLSDVVGENGSDNSLRPNQIFAVGLHHTMVSKERAKRIVEVVENELLTPFGLRSLDRSNPDYRPLYEGGPQERDGAYHQGTVWAWLIGPFIDAYRDAMAGGKSTEKRIEGFMDGFRSHLAEAGLNQVSEIFDAESPHLPRGCFAQAWSVAELLRVRLG